MTNKAIIAMTTAILVVVAQPGRGVAAGPQLAATSSRGNVTALSKKVDVIGMGWNRSAVIGALGEPSHVIPPSKLKANDIDRGPEIEYVLTWDNPGCSRIEVFFNARHSVTGTDAGRMCAYPLKPLPDSLSCSKPSNKNYCR